MRLPRRPSALGALVAAAAALVVPRDARAFPYYVMDTVLTGSNPSDGATDVPLDVEIRLGYRFGYCPPYDDGIDDPVVRLAGSVDPADEVALTIERGSEIGGARLILTPTVPLAPNTMYEIHGVSVIHPEDVGCFAPQEGVLATFTTGTATDESPPTLDGATWGCETRHLDSDDPGYPTYGSSIDYLTLTLEGLNDDRPDGLSFDVYATAQDAEPSVYRMPASSGSVTVRVMDYDTSLVSPSGDPNELYLPPGPWVLVAVDGAGNRSEPLEVDVPPDLELCIELSSDSSGCSVGGAGLGRPHERYGILLVGTALAIALRRRRRAA